MSAFNKCVFSALLKIYPFLRRDARCNYQLDTELNQGVIERSIKDQYEINQRSLRDQLDINQRSIIGQSAINQMSMED